MKEIVIPVPTNVGQNERETVKNRMAETYGGHTTYMARGGWHAPDGRLIGEEVEVITCLADERDGHPPRAFAEANANWLARNTDEDSVLWFVRQIANHGFESVD
jgi:hypothetical protein